MMTNESQSPTQIARDAGVIAGYRHAAYGAERLGYSRDELDDVLDETRDLTPARYELLLDDYLSGWRGGWQMFFDELDEHDDDPAGTDSPLLPDPDAYVQELLRDARRESRRARRRLDAVVRELDETPPAEPHPGDVLSVDDWLREHLRASGGTAPSADIKAAGQRAGFSEATVKRAAQRIGVRYEYRFLPRRADERPAPRASFWSLPASTETRDAQ